MQKKVLRKVSALMMMRELKLTEDSANELRIAVQETVEEFIRRSQREKNFYADDELISIGIMHTMGPFDGRHRVPPLV